jgi:HEAT repeat protein
MECKNIQSQFTVYLEGSLTEVENFDIKNHLKTCDNCSKELQEMKFFLTVLNNEKIEVPTNNLKSNFDKMLAEEIAKDQTKVVQLQPKQDWKSFLRIAASIAIVISSFLIGKFSSNDTLTTNATAQKNVLAMIENNSASKRILAVNTAEKFTKNDTKIIEALMNRLFFDKNTNVRLAAAETLSKFSSEEIVRDALIKSLETDKNTSVQIELIEILAKIQEKRAIKPMEKMLNSEETPLYVKQQLQLNLPSLL